MIRFPSDVPLYVSRAGHVTLQAWGRMADDVMGRRGPGHSGVCRGIQGRCTVPRSDDQCFVLCQGA